MLKQIVSISNFSKLFGSIKVINDLSFEVNEGEIFAFLGANGSGKTTTIRCLLGIYEPTSGKLYFKGRKYSSAHDAKLVGYLPEERGLYTSSQVLETMVYFGELKGLNAHTARSRALEYLERVGLAEKAKCTIKQLSSGQQQKIQLGITVINQPQLLILDEPTKGLDPENRELLMEILLELNTKGSTIVFSTHQMDEAEKIANRLLMIKYGKQTLYGTINEIKDSFGQNIYTLKFDGALQASNNYYTAKVDTHYAQITPRAGITTEKLLKNLLDQGITLISFEKSTPSLNEIFMQVSRNDYE